jgi:hypothetical protein
MGYCSDSCLDEYATSLTENNILTRKRLLITGCGRSGTKYITHLLRRLGLDVRHERMGEDGITSWGMAVDAGCVAWGVPFRNFAFDHVFHQVRDPREVIASATTFKPDSWSFIRAHTPISLDEPVLLRAAKYWYYWNLEAEKIAHWRYRIDTFHEVFDEFCSRLRLTPDRRVLEHVDPDVNTRRRGRAFHLYEELCERLRLEPSRAIKRWLSATSARAGYEVPSWEMLRAMDAELTEKIQTKALQYGYRI